MLLVFLVLETSALLQIVSSTGSQPQIPLCVKDLYINFDWPDTTESSNYNYNRTLLFTEAAHSVFNIFSYANITVTSTTPFKASQEEKKESTNVFNLFSPILSTFNSGKVKHYHQKVSCLKNLSLSIAFDSTGHTITVAVSTKHFDEISFLLFVIGIILFVNAKSLTRSATFLYSSCASLGVITSFIIVLFILFKLLPYKRSMGFLLFTGSGMWFYFVENMKDYIWSLVQHYPFYVAGYFAISALVSVSLLYYFGPPSNHRSLNLLQWFLQLSSLYIIYSSCYSKEFSVTIIILLITFQYLSFLNLLKRFLHIVFRLPPADDEKQPVSFSCLPASEVKSRSSLQEAWEEKGDLSIEKIDDVGGDLKVAAFKLLENQSKQMDALIRNQQQQTQLLQLLLNR